MGTEELFFTVAGSLGTEQISNRLKNLTGDFVHTGQFNIFDLFTRNF